jgi:transcriptional regulator GlxA family with amidase domain
MSQASNTSSHLRSSRVAQTPDAVTAQGGLRITPHYHFAAHPPIDALIIPSGIVTRELERQELIDWIIRATLRLN